MAKPLTQQKAAFHIFRFLDATWGIYLLIPPRQTMPTPAPVPGTSPLVPNLLDQGHQPTKIWFYLLLCPNYTPEPHLYNQGTSLSHYFWQLMISHG
ncbi:hypothetical protein LEMLEM_LOCUS15429 [Lemmus lemmus]